MQPLHTANSHWPSQQPPGCDWCHSHRPVELSSPQSIPTTISSGLHWPHSAPCLLTAGLLWNWGTSISLWGGGQRCWASAQKVGLIQPLLFATSSSVALAGPLSCFIIVVIISFSFFSPPPFHFIFPPRGNHPRGIQCPDWPGLGHMPTCGARVWVRHLG